MFPAINLKETGINLRRIMDKRGISAKAIVPEPIIMDARERRLWTTIEK